MSKRTPEESFEGLLIEADWSDMHGGGYHDDRMSKTISSAPKVGVTLSGSISLHGSVRKTHERLF